MGTRNNDVDYYGEIGDSDEELLLRVAAGLDNGVAQQALLSAAMEKNDLALRSLEAINVLWKRAVRPGNNKTFIMVTKKIQERKPSELGPFVEVLSHYVDDYGSMSEQFVVLSSIAAKRMDWLKDEIQKLSKTFSWRMPYAQDPANREMEVFLRGPKRSKTFSGVLQKFSGLREAEGFATTCKHKNQHQASYRAEAAEGEDAFVTITKTRQWFEDTQVKLARFQVELASLSEIYKGSASTSPAKKARLG